MIDDGDRRQISIAVSWLSQTFDDLGHLQANTTRALRIFEGSGLAGWQFQEATRAAYSATIHRMADSRRPKLKKPMAYYFTALADQTQRRGHGLTAEQATQLYPGQTGTGNSSKATPKAGRATP